MTLSLVPWGVFISWWQEDWHATKAHVWTMYGLDMNQRCCSYTHPWHPRSFYCLPFWAFRWNGGMKWWVVTQHKWFVFPTPRWATARSSEWWCGQLSEEHNGRAGSRKEQFLSLPCRSAPESVRLGRGGDLEWVTGVQERGQAWGNRWWGGLGFVRRARGKKDSVGGGVSRMEEREGRVGGRCGSLIHEAEVAGEGKIIKDDANLLIKKGSKILWKEE